jgi:RNA polymerase sigma-70 factor (ECF subfamily)
MTGEAFAKAVTGMTQTLYRVSCSQLPNEADREDAVQEALRRAWEKRGSLKDDRYLRTWVVRILLNVCHDI